MDIQGKKTPQKLDGSALRPLIRFPGMDCLRQRLRLVRKDCSFLLSRKRTVFQECTVQSNLDTVNGLRMNIRYNESLHLGLALTSTRYENSSL